MLKRIILGVGANAIAQVVIIVIQLLSLPIFLLYWNDTQYGAWILLSALPAYLSMADAGMIGAAGNKMTMAMGRSDLAEANAVYQSAQLFMASICGVLAVVVVPAALLAPMPERFGMTMDKRVALAALLLAVLCALYGGLSEAVFKATHRYAVGTVLGTAVRFAEWLGYIIGLVLFRTFAGVALCGLLCRAAGTAIGVLLAQRGGQGLKLGFAQASRAELREMVKPAVSFMAFPFANALSFQGVTLVVGALVGAAPVVLFNAYRTLSRIAVQATAMLSHALWPEFSRLFGIGGMKAVRPLFERSSWLSALQSAGLSVVLYIVGPLLLRIWTHGRVEFVPSLMIWLLAYAAVSGAGHVPRIVLMATNKHVSIAFWTVVAGLLAVGLAWLFGTLWGLEGVCASMLVSESFISGVYIFMARRAVAGR